MTAEFWDELERLRAASAQHSASSMQSPPASAEATRVSILSPVFVRPGHVSEVNVVVDECTQTQALGGDDRKAQPSIGHQEVVVEGDMDPVGVVAR